MIPSIFMIMIESQESGPAPESRLTFRFISPFHFWISPPTLAVGVVLILFVDCGISTQSFIPSHLSVVRNSGTKPKIPRFRFLLPQYLPALLEDKTQLYDVLFRVLILSLGTKLWLIRSL